MITVPWIPLGLIGILSWSVWFVRRTLSRHGYREVVNDFRTTTSLVVPVYREDSDVLERCIHTWLAEGPTEIILVVDDRDDLVLARLRRLNLPTVKVLPWRHTGKRSALGAGVRAATGEIVVFSDSDTSWRPGCSRSCRCRSSTRRSGEWAAASTCTCPAATSGAASPTGC